jgi:autotransporter translocation and assembly factor TamB
VRVALSKIDGSKLGASGSLDGELAISAIDAGGKVDVKGVVTEVGTIDSQLALAPGPRGEIAAHGTLHLGGVDPVDVRAILSLPIHPFDPGGWEKLGRETLRGATIEAKRIAFDPDLMKRFGVDSPWRGWAAVKIQIGPAARSSEFAVDVHELRDNLLTKPLEVHIAGASDASGPRLDATVRTDTLSLSLAAKSPLSVESMLAGNVPSVPIEASVTVPPTAARELAMLIGRKDVLAGTVAGSVNVGGTIEAPTARAQLTVDNLSVSAGLTRKPPTLEKLEVDARWHGVKTGFELELTGHETGGRLLKISARGKPESLDSVVASIEAASFDITPFLAFVPEGPTVGMRGLISGVLKLRGLDPQTGDVRGRLVISDLRVPLTAELGTLRSGQLEISVVKKEVHATLDGKIGRGTIKGKSVMRLTGSMPTAAELTLALRKVSPIGAIQPQIDADISGWFARTRTKWAGKITIANGNIYVPPEGGNELLGTGAPGDIVFIDAQPIVVKPKRKQAAAPWLLADIDIQPAKLLVEDTDFNFTGIASGQLKLQVGDGISLDGAISTETGTVEVLGRRYRLDHGVVDFDGSLDPRLDIRLMRDFSSMTLTVDILGRSSNPDLRLSSDNGSYSQGQLLSFLAGATPSDDPSAQSGDAIASGSLTILSSRVGKKLNQYVPLIKFDTINYEAKTASSSRAIRVGKRIGEHTYLNFRNRFEPRPDENAREAVIEHELRRNLLIEATGGDRGAGADLLWRKRW